MTGQAAEQATEPVTGQAPDATGLCTHCGFCCDGTMFRHANAHPEDRDGLIRHGVPFDAGADQPVFPQPCPCLAGTTCTIYPERFVVCRGFRCALLKKFETGAIDLAGGLATIAAARKLLAAVEPAARTLGPRRMLHDETSQWQSVQDPAERRDMARRHLAIVLLERFLDLHFRDGRRTAAAPPP